jgi:hypothetical protein
MKDHSRSASIGALIPQSIAIRDATVIPAISSNMPASISAPNFLTVIKIHHNHVCFHGG